MAEPGRRPDPGAAERAARLAERAAQRAERAERARQQAEERTAQRAERALRHAEKQAEQAARREVARRPGRPRSAEAEQAIVTATVAVLAEQGVSGLSVEAVAARAGVGKTTIYRRWADKNELILDVLTRIRGPVLEPPPGQSVRDDLVFLLRRMRASHLEEPWGGLVQKLVASARDYPEIASQYVQRVVGPRRERFVDVLRRGVAEGTVRPDVDPSLAAEALIAPILLGSWVPAGPRVREDRIPELVDLVLAGIATAGRRDC